MSHLDEVRLYGYDEMPRTEIELKLGMSIEIRSKAKLKPMHHEETFFDALKWEPRRACQRAKCESTPPVGGETPSTTREAHTKNIQAAFALKRCTTVVYGNKIILLPVPGH